MMTNLFSVFDPSSSFFHFSLNWVSLLVVTLVLICSFWVSTSRSSVIFSSPLKSLMPEMKVLVPDYNFRVILFPLSLFMFILLNNIMGLLPFVFTGTSHLSVTLSLSLPLWVGFMLYGFLNNTMSNLSHLVPQGTPPLLMPFMVIIETISNMIRPLTLAVRLAANMIAGHLLMALLGGAMDILSLGSVMGVGAGLILLIILESAVAMIQAYVFSTLVMLYISEV